MSTLHDRIRAVVEERLRIARAVAGYRQRPGELLWTPCDPEQYPGLIGDALGNVVTYDVGNREQVEHIAANDPADAILGAEHALDILERHHPDPVMESPRCICVDPWSLEDPWPCDEIRALATRWRVEVDG